MRVRSQPFTLIRSLLGLLIRYGRHSKSIRPSEQVCGRCKGKLKPLFKEKESKVSGWTRKLQSFSSRLLAETDAIPVFVKEQIGPMLASNPGMTRGGAMKEIGKLWRLRGQPSVTDIESVAEGLSSLSMGT